MSEDRIDIGKFRAAMDALIKASHTPDTPVYHWTPKGEYERRQKDGTLLPHHRMVVHIPR